MHHVDTFGSFHRTGTRCASRVSELVVCRFKVFSEGFRYEYSRSRVLTRAFLLFPVASNEAVRAG